MSYTPETQRLPLSNIARTVIKALPPTMVAGAAICAGIKTTDTLKAEASDFGLQRNNDLNPQCYTITNLNLRSQPTTNSEKIMTFPPNAQLVPTGRVEGEWMEVENDGGGYVHLDYTRGCITQEGAPSNENGNTPLTLNAAIRSFEDSTYYTEGGVFSYHEIDHSLNDGHNYLLSLFPPDYGSACGPLSVPVYAAGAMFDGRRGPGNVFLDAVASNSNVILNDVEYQLVNSFPFSISSTESRNGLYALRDLIECDYSTTALVVVTSNEIGYERGERIVTVWSVAQ